MTSICVFCGAKDGVDSKWLPLARQVGAALARRSIRVVYGGGGVGLMGAVAGGALDAGGEVIGVIPPGGWQPAGDPPGTGGLHG
jgi:predicted Rossmann-fold nucleotide-binding protein